jgi:hypothetical protein
VTKTSEAQIQAETADKQFDPVVPSKKLNRKSILALSVFALGLNATAAVYTMSPSDFSLPDFALPDFGGMVAEVLPHQTTPSEIREAVVAALKDIQSAQQQNAVSLQENGHSLQQNTALLQQDAIRLDGLRRSLSDEQGDVRKISTQLSTLIAKVDSLQNAIAPEVTSSIPKGRARNRLSGMARKRMVYRPKPAGPISVGGAPLTVAPVEVQSPQG